MPLYSEIVLNEKEIILSLGETILPLFFGSCFVTGT